MNLSLFIFIVALILVVVFFRNFTAFVYFVVMTDVFLRILAYLRLNIIKDTAFAFLNIFPASVPDIIKSYNLGTLTEILMFLYVIIYIIFEVFMIRIFVKKAF